MLNFASALYLGLNHPTKSLRPWTQFTTGQPAALVPPPRASVIEKKLAALQGFQRTILGPSTFHLFWDLFGLLAQQSIAIHLDARAYPISQWGVERAAVLGAPVRTFVHHDPDGLARNIRRDALLRRRPIVVTDGFCPGCGVAAPLADYIEIIRSLGGYLIIDDTQALGILGNNPKRHPPYGSGGGGSLRWHKLEDPNIVSVSSLAKGFGVPIAALSGSDSFVRRFATKSETRVHTSPPSIAAIHAAEHALTINQARGNLLRRQLAHGVFRFRSRLKYAGVNRQSGFFPVQMLPVPKQFAERLHRDLRQRGVMTVLQQSCVEHRPCITFVITARHNPDEIDHAATLFVKTISEIDHDGRDGEILPYTRSFLAR